MTLKTPIFSTFFQESPQRVKSKDNVTERPTVLSKDNVTQATILDYNERKRVLNGPAKGWKAHAP
jgi:hypothetical protein